MEDTLRGLQPTMLLIITSLNPCFNGRYSQSKKKFGSKIQRPSLNPCFNGRYSQSTPYQKNELILGVLILVLMEDTLRVRRELNISIKKLRLNPCFNGRYSQRQVTSAKTQKLKVLILVLMEDTLRAVKYTKCHHRKLGLNPCFNGRYSQSPRDINDVFTDMSLNPCFNGRYSQSYNKKLINAFYVLILVLMEDTLRVSYLL